MVPLAARAVDAEGDGGGGGERFRLFTLVPNGVGI